PGCRSEVTSTYEIQEHQSDNPRNFLEPPSTVRNTKLCLSNVSFETTPPLCRGAKFPPRPDHGIAGITLWNALIMSSSSLSVRQEGIAIMMLRSKRSSATGHVPLPNCGTLGPLRKRRKEPSPEAANKAAML